MNNNSKQPFHLHLFVENQDNSNMSYMEASIIALSTMIGQLNEIIYNKND